MRDDVADTSIPAAPAVPDGGASAVAASKDAAPSEDVARLTDEIVTAIKTVYDPEIPADVYELGLIYKIDIADDRAVAIDMTLTAQGCPEHVNISMQVKSRLEQLPGIRNAAVNVVWTPPWTPERLSPDAKKQLGIE